MVKFWWFRGLCLFVMKYFFARSHFRAGVSDFGRNTVAAACLMHLYKNLRKMNEAIATFDKLPHRGEVQTEIHSTGNAFSLLHIYRRKLYHRSRDDYTDHYFSAEDSGKWLTRLVFRMNICVWMYVTLRMCIDVATFFTEDMLAVFIRSELFLDPARIPPRAYPFLLLYVFVDRLLNRLISSVGLLLNPVTYIAFNFVSSLRAAYYAEFVVYDNTSAVRYSQLTFIKFRKFDGDALQCLRKRGSAEEIKKLRLSHADLCQLVIFMDEIYSPLAVFFHGGVVAGYCTETLRFIQVRRSSKQGNTGEYRYRNQPLTFSPLQALRERNKPFGVCADFI